MKGGSSNDFERTCEKLITTIKTDYEWVRVHRDLQGKALEWETSKRDKSFLLHGTELQIAEFQLTINASLALIVWDLSDKKPILELFYPLIEAGTAQIDFSNSGAAADVCSSGTGIRIDISPESWQAQACEIAGRNFTQTEWQQYFPGKEYRKTCDQWPLDPGL